jgi:hypothetical protein
MHVSQQQLLHQDSAAVSPQVAANAKPGGSVVEMNAVLLHPG